MVGGDQTPAELGDGNLTDVHGTDDAGHSDAHTANDAVNDELVKRVAQGTAYGREGKQCGGHNHGRFTAQAVAQRAGHGHTRNGTHQGAAHVPPLLQHVEVVETGHLTDGAADDCRVVTEEKSAAGGDQCQKQHIAETIVFHHGASFN